ncbi:MAG TPA: hypothetical protein VGQ41_12340 [Pyrinomonadaceae bacterium]|jgi:hypothetical protein|nr:hypothetical protein [Pyrinomonadaceae bacterium]
MNESLKPQVRLYCLLAREAPLAAVFRRGPSKQVLLVLWRTDTDQFQEGQWLKGRIYERRCDLSPSGQRLIYFAADYKKPYFSWTAVSKPPFLTALALWPKGDGWGGGGLFEKEHKILLNHRAAEMRLAEGFNLPRDLQITPFGERSGWGEDNPIFDTRLSRDGWRLMKEGKAIEHGIGASIWVEFNPAMVWSKLHAPSGRYELEMHIQGLHEKDGSWYIIEHRVSDKSNGSVIDLGRTDWADWCHSGDLLFGKEGQLFRLGFSGDGILNELGKAKLLINLTDRTFKEVAPPVHAKRWGW